MLEKIKMELTPDELEQLIETADENLRNYIDQARHYVRKGLREDRARQQNETINQSHSLSGDYILEVKVLDK
jgi:hypothetical protein